MAKLQNLTHKLILKKTKKQKKQQLWWVGSHWGIKEGQ